MAKVTMYRGVDLLDGEMSNFVVVGARIARMPEREKCRTYESFAQYIHKIPYLPIDDEDRATLANCEVLWEADL